MFKAETEKKAMIPAAGTGGEYVHLWEDCSRSCTVASVAVEAGSACRNSLCLSGAHPCRAHEHASSVMHY